MKIQNDPDRLERWSRFDEVTLKVGNIQYHKRRPELKCLSVVWDCGRNANLFCLCVNSNVTDETWEVIILWYSAPLKSDPENFIQDYCILTKKQTKKKGRRMGRI